MKNLVCKRTKQSNVYSPRNYMSWRHYFLWLIFSCFCAPIPDIFLSTYIHMWPFSWYPYYIILPRRLTRRMGHLCCNQNQNDNAFCVAWLLNIKNLSSHIWFVNISSAFNLDISVVIASYQLFLSPVRTIMVLRLLHWMRMIWIQQLTLISTTSDSQLNLAYLGTPSVSLLFHVLLLNISKMHQ